jgi:hypothetical protein
MKGNQLQVEKLTALELMSFRAWLFKTHTFPKANTFFIDIACPRKHIGYMNRLSIEERAKVVGCLIEGCSIRSTVRMTGVAKKTVSRILVETGRACLKYQDEVMRGLSCKTLQVDEIWSFVGCKELNASDEQKKNGFGDAWVWVAARF